MPYLNWIDDKALESAVNTLLVSAKKAQQKAVKKFGKNVIDPFGALFEMAGFEIDYETWFKSETARQAQKTLQNTVGEFHQIILGSVKDWQNLKTGNVMDLLSHKHKILAEVKNKHNTVKGSNLSDLYKSLESEVMPKSSKYRGYTAYYVTIIPKKPERFNKPFAPSDKQTGTKLSVNEKIRIIDGASFYDIVTGEKNALENLFEVLPDVIFKNSNGKYNVKEKKNLKTFFSLAFG